MKERNANLDVLRCFSMFLVVLVHSYQFGEYWHASWGLDFLYLLLIRCVRLWHVFATMGVFVIGCLVLGAWRTDYIAPYLVAMAMAMLVLFERFLKFPGWVGRLCVWMAPSMFGVYLLQGCSFGKVFLRTPAQYLAGRGVSPVLVIFLSALVCFAICLTLDLVRRYSLRGIMRFRGFGVSG